MTSFPTTSGIYRITCTVTGKFYIGSAINLSNRKGVHLYELRRNKSRNPKLQNAWNKYGPDAFTFDVLELVLLPEMLTAREQYWLDTLKPFGKNGFNIDHMAGSRLGSKHTPETLNKLRLAHIGRKYSLGRKLSPEVSAKLHAGNIGNTYSLGHKHTPETRAKMRASKSNQMKTLIAISPDGTKYRVHGIAAFCKEHHLIPGELSRVAKGRYSHHRGWKAFISD